jgi:hypothetical protein
MPDHGDITFLWRYLDVNRADELGRRARADKVSRTSAVIYLGFPANAIATFVGRIQRETSAQISARGNAALTCFGVFQINRDPRQVDVLVLNRSRIESTRFRLSRTPHGGGQIPTHQI